MKNLFILIALVAAFLLGVTSTLAIQHYTKRIENKAVVKVVGVGIYKDANFTVSLTEIDWGVLEPGESKNFSAYIVNKSNVPITLSMTTSDWQPINASQFITLSWNYHGEQIPINGYVEVIFTLTVNAAVSGIQAFGFVITIVRSG